MKKILLCLAAGVMTLVALGYTASLRALWRRTADHIEQCKSADRLAADGAARLPRPRGRCT